MLPPYSLDPSSTCLRFIAFIRQSSMLSSVLSHKKETGTQPSEPFLSHTTIHFRQYTMCPVYHEAMITVLFEDCNTFSQEIYDQAVNAIQLHMLECTCGKKGCLIRYGHYKRHLKFRSVDILLIVQRVFCEECGKTHALLLSLIVPYSQIPLEDQQEILACTEDSATPEPVLERNILVDENNVKYIVRQYRRHWKQRLLSIGKTLQDRLPRPCLHAYSRQFMQIHRTGNILFVPPT